MKSMSNILIVIFCLSFNIKGQTLNELENKYDQLFHSWSTESVKIDSLKAVLDKQVEQIDDEKKKVNPNKGRIKNLMAQSVTYTNQISKSQRRIEELNLNIENIKRELDTKYSAAIDSLNMLDKSKRFKGTRDELNSLLLTLTIKRLVVSPSVSALSFQPEKILSIKPEKNQDSVEGMIYLDYLNTALSEVDKNLKEIGSKYFELKRFSELEKRTKKFIAEAEFEGGIRTGRIRSEDRSTSRSGETSTNSDVIFESNSELALHIQNYSAMIDQLSALHPLSSSDQKIYDNMRKKFDTNEYLKLLEELKKRLGDYRNMLLNRIKSFEQ
jgi:septal ring factor EnvC (AmiA/AmiB activator)